MNILIYNINFVKFKCIKMQIFNYKFIYLNKTSIFTLFRVLNILAFFYNDLF